MDPTTLDSGQLVTDVFLVADAKLQVDRRGQNYYNLTLYCEGGKSIDAKVWSDNIGAPLAAGDGIEALGRVDEYLGSPQLNLQRYKVLPDFDESPYVRTADIDADAAFETLFAWDRAEFTNPCYRLLMQEFHKTESFARDFKRSPAATVHHHNYMGGLVEHTLEVWNAADALSAQYERIDRELLLCAAALHDVGKLHAYALTSGVSTPTDIGLLLDHIFVGASMISNMWDRVVKGEALGEDAPDPGTCKAMLLHLILSHHGRRDWGSPVLPAMPEAVLLHFCDQVSASMHSSFEAIDNKPGDEKWTQKVYLMDTPRRLFVPPKNEKADE